MSRCSDAAAWAMATGSTWAAASRRYGVSSGAVRKAARRLRLRKPLSRLELAVALVAAGAATCRKAAAVYGLSATDVVEAWNERYPDQRRVMT